MRLPEPTSPLSRMQRRDAGASAAELGAWTRVMNGKVLLPRPVWAVVMWRREDLQDAAQSRGAATLADDGEVRIARSSLAEARKRWTEVEVAGPDGVKQFYGVKNILDADAGFWCLAVGR